jgi:hypothetical protein
MNKLNLNKELIENLKGFGYNEDIIEKAIEVIKVNKYPSTGIINLLKRELHIGIIVANIIAEQLEKLNIKR